MTTMLAPNEMRKSSLFSIGNLGSEVKPKMTWSKKTDDAGTEHKVLSVTDQPVFRSGTFRDSWGIQTTWEYMYIDQMILNWEHLKNTGIFEMIPARKGHGAMFDDPMNSLVGWHTNLRAEKRESKIDGKEYNYLLASYDLFDEEAQNHVAAGNWPNRSAEVGYFLTNAEAEHWPVYQGFAFVDIPAVEGLNGFSKTHPSVKFNLFMESEEEIVTAPTTPAVPATPPVVTPPVAEHVSSATTPPVADPAPAAAATPAPPAAFTAPTQTINLFGQATTDYAAVQAHIDRLETVVSETTQANRADFVKGLAEGATPKILASAVPDLTEFAQGLTPDQYAKWTAMYEAAPASSLLGQHGADTGENKGVPQPHSQQNVTEAEKSELVGIVSMHRANGMSDEKVKLTNSYKRLTQIAPGEYPA